MPGKDLTLSPRLLSFMERYPWPGNVRQLENLMERLVICCQDPVLDIDALTPEYLPQSDTPPAIPAGGTLEEQLEEFEGRIIRESYLRCGTSVALARELGISQPTAARKIAKYVKRTL